MRFGIIGCGLVAQVMHIPYLAELSDAELHAFVDPAEDRAATLAERYNVPNVYRAHEELLADVGDELDAVVVLTPSHTHADVTVDTLDADIHTLVEKPLAATPEDADRMVEAAEASDATAMVAYMKRYDPSYERAQTVVDELDEIDLVTAYDVDPDHFRIVEEVYDLVPGSPPESVIEESGAKRQTDIEQAIGTDDETLVDAYDFQLEHVCHDVNALRGLFGDVESIDHVNVFADGRYATAHLTYEDGVECILETGDSDRKWFEEFVRVDSPEGMVTVDFSNPFIKNTPTELRIKEGTEELTDTVETPSYEEPFKRELEYFLDCTEGEAPVRTTFAEARDDLQVIVDLFRTYRGETPQTDD
ncbi:Gfo/Idh/MocA family oxidoreductase [Halomicroarcula sp. F13]|uniref:Gfo/Idh/MocA family oxidoreductase n=1 Tax=Haloarcula rubra TaxID=2487747 RepID=A0AAW4PYC2_9EURY|nr:Gfo/Idh/MocA family oxidoreductase [Halomicroarcula rubra]MBX0325094.1 Gfo/Idh/MocA family oxidoreductase [Halomicroarcula rubra]